MIHLRKINLRRTLSTLSGIAIAGGAVGIIGSGVAGLVAGSEAQKDRASERTIVSTGICGLGLASAISLSMSQPEN
ncbi:hypothetical protein [Halomicronema sp. CCY15110]|uniref:hypothetical protein n=1 Tax=Halomicronema sp. CCY15110 TaxID=2767773 RepID=UPI001951B482|nr:hypothetical protein [Halomicronema sp. CCY15110]